MRKPRSIRRLFVLPLLFLVIPHSSAGPSADGDAPCAGSVLVATSYALPDAPLACNGSADCPGSAPAPCHWNLEGVIEGLGLVNAAVESGANADTCATVPAVRSCIAHTHFQHPPATTRDWTCRIEETTVAAIVELRCTLTFDGFR
jgi:hypothetical protein